MSAARGFTLIETMIVVVVIGIVLTAGLPAFGNYRNTVLLRQARSQLLGDMRMARQMAVTRRAPVFIRFGTPPTTTNLTSYTIHLDKNANGIVDNGDMVKRREMPGKGASRVVLSSVNLAPVDSIAFDISGILRPSTGGGTLIYKNSRGKYDTLAISTAGIAYRP